VAEWEKIYSKTLKFEGGFQDDPKDKGNWTGGEVGLGELRGTKYGISAKSYPNLDIKSLTEEQALEIYRRDYWQAMHLSAIDSNRIAWKIFDISINCGQGTAAKILQKSVGVEPDGLIGDVTLRAVNLADHVKLMAEIIHYQQHHYLSIRNSMNEKFFKGWMKRSEDSAPELETI
jgi:lysozyme family protein